MNTKNLNAIRLFALLCIAGKVFTVAAQFGDASTSLWMAISYTLSLFILLFLGYFSIEYSIRFFIWPQIRSIYAISIFNKKKKTAIAKTVEPETEPKIEDELSPLDSPKAKEVIEYTLGTFADVLTNIELMVLERNLKVFILGEKNLSPAVNRRITNLTTMDICHYGWNISRRLNISNDDMAGFIKSQFIWQLNDCSISTISKKLSYDTGKFFIEKIDPKEALSTFPLARKLGIC